MMTDEQIHKTAQEAIGLMALIDERTWMKNTAEERLADAKASLVKLQQNCTHPYKEPWLTADGQEQFCSVCRAHGIL
jgi:hypothetical protein